jgi:hypothetical protein
MQKPSLMNINCTEGTVKASKVGGVLLAINKYFLLNFTQRSTLYVDVHEIIIKVTLTVAFRIQGAKVTIVSELV